MLLVRDVLTFDEAKRRAIRDYLYLLFDEYDGNMMQMAQVAGRWRQDLYKIVQQYAPELLTDPKRQARIAERRLEHIRRVHGGGNGRARGGNAAWKALDVPEARA